MSIERQTLNNSIDQTMLKTMNNAAIDSVNNGYVEHDLPDVRIMIESMKHKDLAHYLSIISRCFSLTCSFPVMDYVTRFVFRHIFL
jgi:hypothetical protein